MFTKKALQDLISYAEQGIRDTNREAMSDELCSDQDYADLQAAIKIIREYMAYLKEVLPGITLVCSNTLATPKK